MPRDIVTFWANMPSIVWVILASVLLYKPLTKLWLYNKSQGKRLSMLTFRSAITAKEAAEHLGSDVIAGKNGVARKLYATSVWVVGGGRVPIQRADIETSDPLRAVCSSKILDARIAYKAPEMTQASVIVNESGKECRISFESLPRDTHIHITFVHEGPLRAVSMAGEVTGTRIINGDSTTVWKSMFACAFLIISSTIGVKYFAMEIDALPYSPFGLSATALTDVLIWHSVIVLGFSLLSYIGFNWFASIIVKA